MDDPPSPPPLGLPIEVFDMIISMIFGECKVLKLGDAKQLVDMRLVTPAWKDIVPKGWAFRARQPWSFPRMPPKRRRIGLRKFHPPAPS